MARAFLRDEMRDLDITLIFGARVTQASVVSKPGQNLFGSPLKLDVRTIDAKPALFFTGTGQVAADEKSFTLTGKVDWSFGSDANPTMQPLTAKLVCEELDDMAIGH